MYTTGVSVSPFCSSATKEQGRNMTIKELKLQTQLERVKEKDLSDREQDIDREIQKQKVFRDY
jgi:adenine C2-methylase RlmN of 23S rRNA A2503 and tRNA A37